MRALAAAAVLAAALAAAQGVDATQSGATLRLLTRAPLAVRGYGFAARERVRLDLRGDAVAQRRTTTTATGTFVVRFSDVTLTRCDTVRLVAIGASGDRATLKLLPAPACLPE